MMLGGMFIHVCGEGNGHLGSEILSVNNFGKLENMLKKSGNWEFGPPKIWRELQAKGKKLWEVRKISERSVARKIIPPLHPPRVVIQTKTSTLF